MELVVEEIDFRTEVGSLAWLLSEKLLSREKFAYDLGIAPKTIYFWERQIFMPEMFQAEYLAGRPRKRLDRYQRFLLIFIYKYRFDKDKPKRDRTYFKTKKALFQFIRGGASRVEFTNYYEEHFHEAN